MFGHTALKFHSIPQQIQIPEEKQRRWLGKKKGEKRRKKGGERRRERRKEKGERRKEKGERRKEKGERKET